MADYLKRSWAEINLDALAFNVEQIRSRLSPGCRLMAVVKADAYGHGAYYTAKKFGSLGADWFGVSNLEEALELRRVPLEQPILIFGTTPTELAGVLAQGRITQAVYSADYARELQEAARTQDVVVDIHLKLDTGMTRLGFLCDDASFEESLAELLEIASYPNLAVCGAFTHFSAADEYQNDSPAFTQAQFERFLRMTQALEAHGVPLPLRHCCNSPGLLSYPEMHLDMARPGDILYGMDPSPECVGMIPLKPVLTLRSVVASVKRVAAGSQVSYGRTYTTPTEAVVAVVPIGYADGYRRTLSHKARMLVNGQFAPVIGTVCMDQLMLDVTDIPGVKRGDPVVVMGAQGENRITADELAELLGTVNYEITCQLTKRIPRVYTEGGREVFVECYNSPKLL